MRYAVLAVLLASLALPAQALAVDPQQPASGPYAQLRAVGRVYAVGQVQPIYPGSPYVELSFVLRVLQPDGLSSAYLVFHCFGPDAYVCSRLVTGTVLGVTAAEVDDSTRQVTALAGGGL